MARVGEVGDHGGDAAGRRGFTGVDHDEEFHEAVIDVTGGGRLEDEHCRLIVRSLVDVHGRLRKSIPSSSRTLSPMVILVS